MHLFILWPWNPLPKAQSLWEAKMVLRDKENPDRTPRYPMSAWAGWVLSGSGE